MERVAGNFNQAEEAQRICQAMDHQNQVLRDGCTEVRTQVDQAHAQAMTQLERTDNVQSQHFQAQKKALESMDKRQACDLQGMRAEVRDHGFRAKEEIIDSKSRVDVMRADISRIEREEKERKTRKDQERVSKASEIQSSFQQSSQASSSVNPYAGQYPQSQIGGTRGATGGASGNSKLKKEDNQCSIQ